MERIDRMCILNTKRSWASYSGITAQSISLKSNQRDDLKLYNILHNNWVILFKNINVVKHNQTIKELL